MKLWLEKLHNIHCLILIGRDRVSNKNSDKTKIIILNWKENSLIYYKIEKINLYEKIVKIVILFN